MLVLHVSMDRQLYSFPRDFGSTDDPMIGLIKEANLKFPGFISFVVDGGAGIGDFTDKVLKTSTGCRVIAFEPLPENAAVLRSRFAESESVDIREVAVGDRSASVSFQVPERAGIPGPGSYWAAGTSYGGWVSRPFAIDSLLSRTKTLAKKILRQAPASELETISVPMVRLDFELISPPDLIKLDLQGGEPDAMDGLGTLLAGTKAVKLEVLLHGAMPGQGGARTRCVRALQDAGFTLFVEDFQFAVTSMSDGLRRTLADAEMVIERERRFHPTQPVHIMGKWPTGKPLPIQSIGSAGLARAIKLKADFFQALSGSGMMYFSIDLIALNNRFAREWRTILPQDIFEHAEGLS